MFIEQSTIQEDVIIEYISQWDRHIASPSPKQIMALIIRITLIELIKVSATVLRLCKTIEVSNSAAILISSTSKILFKEVKKQFETSYRPSFDL